MEHVVNIGDIDVYKEEDIVKVTVDEETVLFMLRDSWGLELLADTLKSLVIHDNREFTTSNCTSQ